jgi:uncharacterized repeat protein (TIGR01451 family)
LAAILACFCQTAFAQVPVHINSGNPVFPFPQFLPYVHPNGDTLHNLATHNPAGVVHAEMEQSIRDAYQIMMNRALYHEDNISLNGVRYIRFRSNPYCSEGYGYALLAAAMMADKTTFDGLWLYIHDYTMNNTISHRTGQHTSPGYQYSTLFSWINIAAADNSATDGDVDIAFALMIAHMQWGDLMGINNSRGQPISYKDDFIKVLRGLTDTLTFASSGNRASIVSGVVGLDGYIKNGDSWSELTDWSQSSTNLLSIGVARQVETAGPQQGYVDYFSPSYFRQFADFLRREDPVRYAWNIFQFERGEASSCWVYGRHIQQNERHIPFAGHVNMINDTTPVFSSSNEGEDFRAGWRTVLNYVWHGNPDYTWNPISRTVIRNRSNTFQRDSGLRFARFLWDRRQAPWNQGCERIIGEGNWWGPSMIKWFYSPDGSNAGTFPLNWVHGTGSPSAVTSQDMNLMAEMYRQAEIEWDVDDAGDRYLTSTPFYFHGFFRLLGMMTLTGNNHAPLNMKRSANMKVYLDVDKTYAFENDTITYTIDYRNYGAEDAQNVVITNRLHSDMIPITAPGMVYDAASHTVRWNVGIVPGFRTTTGIAPTTGTRTLQVIIPYANLKRYENSVEITASNGPGWVSNEFPNKISSVMKRNGVDMARRALLVEHSVFRDTVNPGMSVVYTIDFENSSEAGWLNGGRPGMNFTYAHKGTAAMDGQHTFMLRAFHDAHEAYVDYGNYRISYFMFDNNYRGMSTPQNQNGWSVEPEVIYPSHMEDIFLPDHEMITPGQDARGRWNQRLIVQLSDVRDPSRLDPNWATMAAPTPFLINYTGLDRRVHRGVSWPFKANFRVWAGTYANRNWGDDWSFNPNVRADIGDDAMANWGFPISPDFTESYDPDYQGRPVTAVHRKLCEAPRPVIDNILIEEWDGYTWRRVFGNGPLPGREVNNVIVRCTIPDGVTFLGFRETTLPHGIQPTTSTTSDGRIIITWQAPSLLIGEKGKIQYNARADTPSVFTDVRIRSRAWVSATNESPTFSMATLVVTRDSLPPPPPPPTTMYKTANKETYYAGDTITYTIAYKQTHGYPAASTSSSQWTGTGTGNVSADGQTITLPPSVVTNLQFTPSYGTDGMIGGTIIPHLWEGEPVYIFARSNGTAGNGVELGFRLRNPEILNGQRGVEITISSNSTSLETIAIPLAGDEMNYKMVFQNDSLLLWFGDTSTVHPFGAITGITTQAGHAGVRAVNPNFGTSTITGWHTHFDLAYNVTIRDTIPWGIRYIDGSATGRINTTTPPRDLTPAVSGGAIILPVVSGFGPSNALGANDSLTLTWRGVVDTARNRIIVNTAYADVAGYPRDSLGAFVVSRFAIEGQPDTIIDPPDSLSLHVRVNPRGGIFTGTLSVTLTASQTGAVIYYTRNGSDPTMTSPARQRYDGQPIQISTATTLRAAAHPADDDFEWSGVTTQVYEPLVTVPVRSAFYFDNVGNGLAQGVKLLLPVNRSMEPNLSVIRRHLDLIELPGSPTIDTVLFSGDTLTILFRGAGIHPASDARLVIGEPSLPSTRYTSEHGYLAAGTVSIIDGVPPVIVEAVYYVSLSENSFNAVFGDTLVITFNKYASLASMDGLIAPFVFSNSSGTYELLLHYEGHAGNAVYFSVRSMIGQSTASVPAQGDSVRIKADGSVMNLFSFTQDNPNNRAVALKVVYPEMDYIIRVGPSPFREELRVWVTVDPYLPPVFGALNPQVRIFDRMGTVVAATGENLEVKPEGTNYVLIWDGRNRKGRRAAAGAYLVHVVVTDQNGGKKVLRRMVYLDRN